MQLGLLLLIATPIARVVFSIFGFMRQRDWLYVGVTATVLALLVVQSFREFVVVSRSMQRKYRASCIPFKRLLERAAWPSNRSLSARPTEPNRRK